MDTRKYIKQVLVIRCGALGDLVYSTSIIEALRTEYGNDITIDFVCKPGPGTIFQLDPRIRNTFPLNHKRFPIWLSSQKRTIINYSKKYPYDLLVNLESDGPIFNPLAKAIQAKYKIGAPFTKPIDKKVDHIVDVIKTIFTPAVSEYTLETSNPSLIGSSFINIQSKYNLPDNYIVLNPSNSHNKRHLLNYRAWPQSYWKELLSILPQDIIPVIIAAKGEDEFFKPIKPFPSQVIDLIGKSPLPDLISIIANAKAIVTTDTGPAHIASAVNTPILVLVGPTPPSTWPYKTPSNIVKVLSANLECSPCYHTKRMHECMNIQCMQKILPEHVRYQLITLLNFNSKVSTK